MRHRLHHAPRVARGAETTAFAGMGDEEVMPAVITGGLGKTVGKNAAFKVFAKRLADKGLGHVVDRPARRTVLRFPAYAKSQNVR